MRHLLLLLLLSLCACEPHRQESPVPDTATAVVAESPPRSFTPLLKEPVEPLLVEASSEALAAWRPVGDERPALLLLANDPLLRPLPSELADEILALARSGSPDDLRRRGTARVPDPLLLPEMTVTAALRADFFSRLIWVLPLAAEGEPDLDTLRAQLRGYGALTEDEAATLRLEAGGASGTAQGLPLRIVPLAALEAPAETVVLHIDLSYFRPLYKGEIKTPLYPLLGQILQQLRGLGMTAGAVTISHSNLDGGLPLETRFIGDDLAEIFRRPELLDSPLPELWDQRSRTLYLANFFQKERIRELLEDMRRDAPEDASVAYAHYQILRQFREGSAALAGLDRAVALDSAYAREYLDLVSVALEKDQPEESLRMLELAAKVFPGDPFIPLDRAGLLLRLGRGREGREILQRLQKLPWSPVYYPDLPQRLEEMAKTADHPDAPAR
jgi:tetratricopeptide (TPR) repeat protein